MAVVFGINCENPQEGFGELIVKMLINFRVPVKKAAEIAQMMLAGECSLWQAKCYVNRIVDGDDMPTVCDVQKKMDGWEGLGYKLSEEDRAKIVGALNDCCPKFETQSPLTSTPQEIYEQTVKTIKGQDEAAMKIAKKVWLFKEAFEAGIQLKQSGVLLIGDTGSGKTELLSQVAKNSGCSHITIHSSQLVNAGYRGGVTLAEMILPKYLAESPDCSKPCLLIVDEADKITRSGHDASYDAQMQAQLMCLVDPHHILRASVSGEIVEAPIRNFLVFFVGAFSGIEKIVSKRLNLKKIGFDNKTGTCVETGNLKSHVTHVDLESWGVLAELCGRTDIIALNPMSEGVLYDILEHSAGCPLRNYEEICQRMGKQLHLDDETKKVIVNKALASGRGARNLNTQKEYVLKSL